MITQQEAEQIVRLYTRNVGINSAIVQKCNALLITYIQQYSKNELKSVVENLCAISYDEIVKMRNCS